MANTLKGWLADNTVTADPNDKILVLESTGKADSNKIYEEMLNEDGSLNFICIIKDSTLYRRGGKWQVEPRKEQHLRRF